MHTLLFEFSCLPFIFIAVVEGNPKPLEFKIVHSQVSPSSYQGVGSDTFAHKAVVGFEKTSSYRIHIDGRVPTDSETFIFSELKKGSLYFYFITYSIANLFLFFSVLEFQRLIESVKEIRTF